MSFQPVIPMSGYTGWAFLKRTMESQQKHYDASPPNKREVDYFRANIAKVRNAEDLVSDRRLLRVALTAFGLEADINAKAFIRKILESDTSDPRSLANRLADKHYAALAKTFDFNGASSKTAEPGFADALVERFTARRFEAAIGETDESMRLAMNAEREILELAESGSSENTKWFTMMGNKPLRRVFETAFGLPTGFANIDIDQQLTMLKAKAHSRFGDDSLSQFTDTAKMQKLIRTYLVRDQVLSGNASWSPAQIAMQLLSPR